MVSHCKDITEEVLGYCGSAREVSQANLCLALPFSAFQDYNLGRGMKLTHVASRQDEKMPGMPDRPLGLQGLQEGIKHHGLRESP